MTVLTLKLEMKFNLCKNYYLLWQLTFWFATPKRGTNWWSVCKLSGLLIKFNWYKYKINVCVGLNFNVKKEHSNCFEASKSVWIHFVEQTFIELCELTICYFHIGKLSNFAHYWVNGFINLKVFFFFSGFSVQKFNGSCLRIHWMNEMYCTDFDFV